MKQKRKRGDFRPHWLQSLIMTTIAICVLWIVAVFVVAAIGYPEALLTSAAPIGVLGSMAALELLIRVIRRL